MLCHQSEHTQFKLLAQIRSMMKLDSRNACHYSVTQKITAYRDMKIIIMPLVQKICVTLCCTLRKDYKYGCLQIDC
jgi:hypothetical protein